MKRTKKKSQKERQKQVKMNDRHAKRIEVEAKWKEKRTKAAVAGEKGHVESQKNKDVKYSFVSLLILFDQ